ncbi:unnamed protein product, partial [Caretta caretta]
MAGNEERTNTMLLSASPPELPENFKPLQMPEPKDLLRKNKVLSFSCNAWDLVSCVLMKIPPTDIHSKPDETVC